MNILISLTPSESKRLIGIAVAQMVEVKTALSENKILISNGTTTAYVAEEILGIHLDIERFPCGVITDGVQCQSPDSRVRSILIDKGKFVQTDETISDYEELKDWIEGFGPNDIYIKGANAVDKEGNAGYLLAHPEGGNIMLALPKIAAQGSRFIIPVGLEKMVASVADAGRAVKGIRNYDYSYGRGCGYITITNGIIITEIEAISMLTGATATHVASGGVGGSEGSVTLSISGKKEDVEKAVGIFNRVKGEDPVESWKKKCGDCPYKCSYMYNKC